MVWQTGQTLWLAAVVAGPVCSGGTVGHPLPQGLGVGLVGAQPVGGAVDGHGRNAKLIFGVTLHADAQAAGVYSRPEMRRRGLRRPPVTADLSSNEHRNV